MSEDGESDYDNSRPITPTNDDCCGNACNPCIFEVHKRLLEQWEKRKSERIKGRRNKNVLNPLLYKKFHVTEIAEVAEAFVIMRLHYCESQIDRDSSLFINPGQHVILSIDKQSKPYTPISWTRSSFELLIRVYSNGAFTKVLKGMKIGDEIRVRGPYGDFLYKPNSFKQIVGFCIGSGIAAICPIARAIVDNEDDETKMNLVAGFPSVANVPLKNELRLLSDYWNVNCTLHLSRPMLDGSSLSGVEIRQGRLSESAVAQILENYSVEQTLILICGTDEFNASVERWIKKLGFNNHHTFS